MQYISVLKRTDLECNLILLISFRNFLSLGEFDSCSEALSSKPIGLESQLPVPYNPLYKYNIKFEGIVVSTKCSGRFAVQRINQI